MPKNKKAVNGKITVRGIECDRERFKPRSFLEDEIPGILDALSEIGYLARTRYKDVVEVITDLDDWINSSSLFEVEGLLRFQFEELFDEHGIRPEELETTSDLY